MSENQESPDSDESAAAHEHSKALEIALGQAEKQQRSAYQKAKKYWEDWGNRVGAATLILLFVYTGASLYEDRAMLAANGISQQSLLDSQRPYISITLDKAIGSVTQPIGQDIFVLPIDIQNSGNTWAKNMVLIVACPTPTDGQIDNSYTGWNLNTTNRIGPPHVTILGGNCGFTWQQAYEIENGSLTAFVGVDVFYRDIISDKDLWETRFCTQIENLTGEGTPSHPWNWEGHQCPFNNCVDDQCNVAPNHYCPVKLKRFPRKALFSAAFRAKLAGVDFN